MTSSPKGPRRRLSRQELGLRALRVAYPALVLAAIYAVYRSVEPPPGSPPTPGLDTASRQWAAADDVAPPGLDGAEHDLQRPQEDDAQEPQVEGGHSQASEESDKEREKERRWSERPSSLCYGHGGRNLTVVTLAVDLPQNYMVQLRRNRLQYVRKHEYRYCEVSTSLDFFRPNAWSKIKAVLLVLSFSETVVSMDADALFVNKSVTFEQILDLPEYNISNKDIVYTADFGRTWDKEPDGRSPINPGVYIVRSTHWAKSYLESLYRLKKAPADSFHEAKAVDLYRSKHRSAFAEHVGIIPHRYMNSPWSHDVKHYRPGDFIVHYATTKHSSGKYERLASTFLPTTRP
eukprot:SM000067S20309  [mRNA]  locus=s67:274762:277632:- [translate_table: standard]